MQFLLPCHPSLLNTLLDMTGVPKDVALLIGDYWITLHGFGYNWIPNRRDKYEWISNSMPCPFAEIRHHRIVQSCYFTHPQGCLFQSSLGLFIYETPGNYLLSYDLYPLVLRMHAIDYDRLRIFQNAFQVRELQLQI